MESDGQISEEAVYELVEELDLKVFAELCESYFYDLLENIPDDQIDLYNLLETIKRVLVGAAEGARQGKKTPAESWRKSWIGFGCGIRLKPTDSAKSSKRRNFFSVRAGCAGQRPACQVQRRRVGVRFFRRAGL